MCYEIENKMDAQTFISLITVIPGDSNKSDVINKIVLYVYEIHSDDLIKLIKLYEIDIFKTQMIQLVQDKLNPIRGSHLCTIIKNMEDKLQMVNMIQTLNDYITSVDGRQLFRIMDLVGGDSNKIAVLKVLILKSEKLSDSRVRKIVDNVTDNCNKSKIIKLLLSKINVTFDCMFPIIKNVKDGHTVYCIINKFSKHNLKITFNQLLQILQETIEQESYKTKKDVVFAISLNQFSDYDGYGGYDNYLRIRDNYICKPRNLHSDYCKRIAETINDYECFMRVANHLHLDSDAVERYKPVRIESEMDHTFTEFRGVYFKKDDSECHMQ
jgi:hypothetical protein